MRTHALFFPFDLFGNPGTRIGAELLADAVREMLADNRREKQAHRAKCYTGKVDVDEVTFETLDQYADWRKDARAAIADSWRDRAFVLWVSGNHLGVLPVYEALAASSGTLVIQLDAHLDIYHLHDCTPELSHGNFLLHAEALPRIVNVGHRELLLTRAHIQKTFAGAYSSIDWRRDPGQVAAAVRREVDAAQRVVIDLDCDVFDPAFFPAVAEPRPFGLAPVDVLAVLDLVPREKLAGFALSEFEPARDERDRGLATLLWLIEWLLLKIYEA